MPVDVIAGSSPLILTIPHASTEIPHTLHARLNETGLCLTDTAWHVDRLYRGMVQDVTTVRANFHRYVCDANRDPEEETLYPGRFGTALVPMTTLNGEPIWDHPPDLREISTFRSAFHAPYHAAVAAQVARVRAKYGFAIVYDCHATRSRIPKQFDKPLPDISIGTFMGTTCDHKITAQVASICMKAPGYSSVVNGRVAGGWSTRRHGQPKLGVHALQVEVSQAAYLTEEKDPWLYDEAKAASLREVLKNILGYLQEWRPA